MRLKVNHSWKKGGTFDGQVGRPSASFVTLANRVTLDSEKFILDTGATVTLVNDAAMLHDYEPLTNTSYVRVANKETMQVVGEGTLIFLIGDTRLHIPHVGYVPQLSENLISPKVLLAEDEHFIMTSEELPHPDC